MEKLNNKETVTLKSPLSTFKAHKVANNVWLGYSLPSSAPKEEFTEKKLLQHIATLKKNGYECLIIN